MIDPTDQSNLMKDSSSSNAISIDDVVNQSNVPQTMLHPSNIPPNVDDTVSSTLALLTGEALTDGQGSLSLSDLTSDAALADLLNNTQDPTGGGFNSASLESSAAYLSLGQHLSELVGSVAAAANNPQGVLGLPSSSQQNVTTPTSTNNEQEPTGSGTRPLSYTKETDQLLANWVKDQQADGQKVTFASLRSYAKKLVSPENPNFNASVGWVTPFLLRHNLDLKINDRKNPRQTRKTTNPRKLSSTKDGLEEEEDNQNSLMDVSHSSSDERVLDISSLEMVSSLGQPLNPQDIELASNALQLVSATGGVSMETQHPVAMETQDVVAVEMLDQKQGVVGKGNRSGTRSRHTLAEKLEVVRLMRQYNVASHYVGRMIGVATSTLSGWIKLVDQKGAELEALSTNRKRSNRTGQGRPLTYSKEKDELIAQWVRHQQEVGVPVTSNDLTVYATGIIGEENQSFVASVGWRHKFLQRHNLQLQQLHSSYKSAASGEDQQLVPLPVQTEEVCTDDYPIDVEEKTYPDEIIQLLIDWVKSKIAECGNTSVQSFCKKAEELITPVDPMFVATLGWAFKFLHRNYLFLDPKPTTFELGRKRSSSTSFPTSLGDSEEHPAKKPFTSNVAVMVSNMGPQTVTVSPSTGNLCEALLSLSSQSENDLSFVDPGSSSKTYFGKAAREFAAEEKEEVVRYANATTLQKAAMKYGVAAPTVWRWRMELKLHQPKYTANQKKYIVKFGDLNSLKEASQRFGISTKTIQNWRRSLQLDGTLSDVDIAAVPPPSIQDMAESEGIATSGGLMGEEVIPLDSSHFQYVVDGGEVSEGNGGPKLPNHAPLNAPPTTSSLEVTHEVQVQDVGMEYDVISSEGHATKPRCTPEEKMHILQYALKHSIREASLKFGVSPGTLYYWKKNYLTGQQTKLTDSPQQVVTTTVVEGDACHLDTTVVSVPMPLDIISSGQGALIGTGSDPLQALANEASLINDGGVPTASLISAITHTLASATPEQLQSLQQITSDLNLLQAVTTLINSNEAGQLRQATPTEGHRESLSGVISSPTDVLVSFNPLTASNNQTELITANGIEEVAMTTASETDGDVVAMTTASETNGGMVTMTTTSTTDEYKADSHET
jgi:transposase-like protein